MEDDSRDWNKNRKRLLSNLMNPKQRAKIGDRIEGADKDIDWQRVGDLAHDARAVPVPVSTGADGLDAVLAQSVLVENTLPEGSNWDGKSGLLVDDKTYNEMVGGKGGTSGKSETSGMTGASASSGSPSSGSR
jgi:hypothetical protein